MDPKPGDCPCLDGNARFDLFDRALLGTDHLYAEISHLTCRTCGRNWLHYHLEYEAFTGSGRWYRGEITPETAVTTRNAAQIFEELDGYWAGGSYFDGKVTRRSGPLLL